MTEKLGKWCNLGRSLAGIEPDCGARVKGEQWYRVKFDNAVKQCVLNQDVDEGKTLILVSLPEPLISSRAV